MKIKEIINYVQNLFHAEVRDIDALIEPGVAYLKANVPPAVIGLAETILSGAAAGTPWATLASALISSAEAAGVALAEGAAKAALNAAQNNLIAKAA